MKQLIEDDEDDENDDEGEVGSSRVWGDLVKNEPIMYAYLHEMLEKMIVSIVGQEEFRVEVGEKEVVELGVNADTADTPEGVGEFYEAGIVPGEMFSTRLIVEDDIPDVCGEERDDRWRKMIKKNYHC